MKEMNTAMECFCFQAARNMAPLTPTLTMLITNFHAKAMIDIQRPNGWRLSGDGGEADGVRCSRGLGNTSPTLFGKPANCIEHESPEKHICDDEQCVTAKRHRVGSDDSAIRDDTRPGCPADETVRNEIDAQGEQRCQNNGREAPQALPTGRHCGETSLVLPNGWRLSGEGGEADRVRCSRGLGHVAMQFPNPFILQPNGIESFEHARSQRRAHNLFSAK